MIEKNAISHLLNLLASHRPDIVFFNHVRVPDDATDYTFQTDLSRCEMIEERPHLYGSKEFGKKSGKLVMWGGIFKTTYLRESNIWVDETLSIGEDTDFYLRLPKCEILLTDMVAYLYRLRSGSATLSDGRSKRNYQALIEMYRKARREGRTECLDDLAHGICTSLVQIKDHVWVMKELKSLKTEGIYPYHFRWAVWRGEGSILKKTILFLMPLYPYFVFLNGLLCKRDSKK